MPPKKITGCNLRERSHNLTISLIDDNMLRKNFLHRLLFTLVESCISCACLQIVLYCLLLLFICMLCVCQSLIKKLLTYLLMIRNAFFCCQRFSASVSDVLHLCAAGVVRHCESEVSAESITLAAVLFELLCVKDESYSIDFKTVLLLAILTLSADNDVLDAFRCF